MNEEQLKDIKNTRGIGFVSLERQVFNSLIERAEQNKKDWLNTMERLENYEKVASLNHEEIQRLREQNKRYREALEFYAMSGQAIGETKHGEVARKALEGDSE